MASETTNYGLVKPAENDYYDIGVYNGNLDKLDAALQEAEAAATGAAAAATAAQGKLKDLTLPAAGWIAVGSTWQQTAFMAGLSDDHVLSWSWSSSADGLACVAAELLLDASFDAASGSTTLTWTTAAKPAADISVFVVAELPAAIE